LFGTDGVRGVANIAPMTPEVVMRLGRAIAHHFAQQAGGAPSGERRRRARIVIGKDTRLSGYMFESALETGIVSQGADVMLCGPLPTPGIAFITASMRADAGVVISASHNPYQDNGIKLFARDGFKLADSTEVEIERLMEAPELDRRRPAASGLGHATKLEDAIGRYVVFLKAVFPGDRTLDGVRIVMDCAHGAAYRVAPTVFSELGAQVTCLGVKPDGRNINDRVGALFPDAMCRAVVKSGALLGVALDGDADRVMFSDERGRVVDGDAIMAICATRMLAAGALRRRTLVTTVMSNLGLERAIAKARGELVRTQVGDRYVVDEMRAHGYNFGGEQSGHLIFLDHMTTGDGIVAALRLLAIMLAEGRPLSELAAAAMQRYPQVLVSVRVRDKRPVEHLPDVARAIARVERALGQEGRVLVRYSGTESKARVMVEGPDEDRVRSYAEQIASTLERAVG
jgi:phosphoglucosamine mutase